jgi:hypothetical protein
MKKIWIAGLVVAVGLMFFGTSVYAQCGGMGGGYGPRGGGFGPGGAWSGASNKPVDVNALRAFQKETLPLRDEAMAKKLEIRNEYGKEKPDQAKVATLEKDLIDLRTKIQAAAEKQGLPAAGFGPGFGGRGPGHGPRMAGGGYGGPGFGGRGPGGRNCPAWH